MVQTQWLVYFCSVFIDNLSHLSLSIRSPMRSIQSSVLFNFAAYTVSMDIPNYSYTKVLLLAFSCRFEITSSVEIIIYIRIQIIQFLDHFTHCTDLYLLVLILHEKNSLSVLHHTSTRSDTMSRKQTLGDE